MMNKSKKYIAIAFVVVLIVVVIVSTVGILSLKNKPEILQGQAEATEIRISGKLPGRIDKFLVEEGQDVLKGDTLVVINSPEIVAKYDQVDAIKNAAVYENQKIEEGTRKQIVESAYQLWMKSKSDLELATTTYNRISSLYRDSVVTSKRPWPANAPPSSNTRWLWTAPASRIGRVPSLWSTPPGARCRKWPRCYRTPGS